jgi:pimeloyl-ACP methyl ester carboxylesterase
MNATQTPATLFVDRPEGRLGYDDQGEGPLVVCVPGMGDPRSTFRYQVPPLLEAGYRVITLDLRGHGDSDTTFSSYDDEAAASDLIALLDRIGSPAVLVGNSMGAGSSVIAAAQRPDLVSGLVLIGPFVRNPPTSKALSLLFRVLTARPWARLVWKAYLPSLYAGRKPADFEAYRTELIQAMARPGYTAAFSKTTRTSHEPAEAAAPAVTAESLVVMGVSDPDFSDPVAEARWIHETLGSTVVTVDDAGHYPHAQQPEVVNAAVISFLSGLDLHA